MNALSTISGMGSILIFWIVLSGCAPRVEPAHDRVTLTVREQQSHTRSLLIGMSPVDKDTVWASGAKGVVVKTVDGGLNWQSMAVPGADTLQFRDVHAVDAHTAYVLSSGVGSGSRIYKTTDGGANWELQFVNREPGGFFDCMDFWDPSSGVAFSDQLDGEFIVIRTENGGRSWTRVPVDSVPDASAGEGSFASSGRCVMAVGDSTAYIGTGAGASARILKTVDRGLSWIAFETPIHGGSASSGISSLSWIDENRGFAFGLDLAGRDSTINNAMKTADGGRSWTLLTPPQLPDVYGGTHVPGRDPVVLVAVGPKGIDFSSDGGSSWTSVSKLDHWGVAFADSTNGWAVGPGGRITKITVMRGS